MGLLTCEDCGNKVSDLASACPKCGCPVQTALGVRTTSPASDFLANVEFNQTRHQSENPPVTLKIILALVYVALIGLSAILYFYHDNTYAGGDAATDATKGASALPDAGLDAAADAAADPAAAASEAQPPPGPSLKSLFDTSIAQSKREEMARDYVAGSYHFADRSLSDLASISNYTFSADGTYESSSCMTYGEISERKFEPHGGRWSIREGRYTNTGMIYYGIWLDDSPGASLLLDRNDGLQFDFFSSNVKIKMLPGNTSVCE